MNKPTIKIKTKNKTQDLNVKAISRNPRPCFDYEHGSSELVKNQASREVVSLKILSQTRKLVSSIFIFIFLDLTHSAVLNLLPLSSCEKRMGVNHPLTFLRVSLIPFLVDNRWDMKSFGDKLPDNIHNNPFFQCLGRHPTSVRVFPDPILFMAGLKPSWEHELAFRNFMYAKTDDIMSFLPKEPSPDFGSGSPSVSINMEPPIGDAEPVSIATRIKDRKCKTRGGSSRPLVKHKLAQGSSSSRATRAKTTSSKDAYPLLIISDDDEGLPDVLEQAIMDNAINRRSQELLKVIEQIRGECDVMKEKERARDEECKGLKAKCEAAMTDFDNNSTVCEKISTLSSKAKEHKANLDRIMLESKKWEGYQVSLLTLDSKVASLVVEKARLKVVKASFRQEVDDVKRDNMEVVSKVVPYIAIELVHSDDVTPPNGAWTEYTCPGA
ncbi:hypothetical protein Tco_0552118 [Tanacetum coccineum]